MNEQKMIGEICGTKVTYCVTWRKRQTRPSDCRNSNQGVSLGRMALNFASIIQ
jgi:hypothetical protein